MFSSVKPLWKLLRQKCSPCLPIKLEMFTLSPCLLVTLSLKWKCSPCRPTACCSPQAPPPRPPAWCAPRRSRIRLWWWSPFQFWNLGQFSCHFISSDLPPPPMRQWQMKMWWQKRNEMTILKIGSRTSGSFPSLTQPSLSKLERRLIIIFPKCW